jgi:hypothetical protein
MIRYFLSVKCSTPECSNNQNATEFWYDNPETSHPCGICGMPITECEVLKQAEFEPYPPPPPIRKVFEIEES